MVTKASSGIHQRKIFSSIHHFETGENPNFSKDCTTMNVRLRCMVVAQRLEEGFLNEQLMPTVWKSLSSGQTRMICQTSHNVLEQSRYGNNGISYLWQVLHHYPCLSAWVCTTLFTVLKSRKWRWQVLKAPKTWRFIRIQCWFCIDVFRAGPSCKGKHAAGYHMYIITERVNLREWFEFT